MKHVIMLLLLTVVMCGVRADSNDGCPLWHYRPDGESECRCGNTLHGAIICSDSLVYLRIDYAMDVLDNTTIVGLSKYAYRNYSALASHLRVYSVIPNTTPQKELNKIMCSKSNREGFLCSKCLPNHGPSAYYYKCIRCDHSLLSSIIIYLITKLAPVMMLYLLILIFRINFTKGPMLGYICFCQVHSMAVKEMMYLYDLLLIKLKHFKLFLTISYCFSAIWNLDLQSTGLIPHFCLSPSLSDFDVLFLNFITVLFPLCLVIITYILIELHARNCRVLVFCWKPFNSCFAKFRRNMSISDSVIHAFSSLMLLSFITLNYNVYSIFSEINVYAANSSGPHLTNILKHHSTTTGAFLKTPKCISYFTISIMLLFFLGVVPSLLLLLYPIRTFGALLQKCFSQRLLLRLDIFLETFQGSFKDGLNGTRDFRIIPGVLALMIICQSIVSCLGQSNGYRNFIMPSHVIVAVTISLLCAYVHPFKSSSSNLSVTFHFMWMAAICFLYMLLFQDLDMDTTVLVTAVAILVPVPHLLMFFWLCHKIQKKLQLCQRCATAFSYVLGEREQCSNTLLPDRLLNSKEYCELLD